MHPLLFAIGWSFLAGVAFTVACAAIGELLGFLYLYVKE